MRLCGYTFEEVKEKIKTLTYELKDLESNKLNSKYFTKAKNYYNEHPERITDCNGIFHADWIPYDYTIFLSRVNTLKIYTIPNLVSIRDDGFLKIRKMNKKNIPTHDPQTGELNPYYEELTGERNPLKKTKEMYKPLPEGLIIRRSEYLSKITGNDENGLFSTKEIPSGTNLGISHVKDERFENGLIRTPLGGFFNHNSKNPNCKTVHTKELVHLQTIVDIKSGDELTSTYTLYNPEEGIEDRKLKNLKKRNSFFEIFFEDFSENEGYKVMPEEFAREMIPYEIIRTNDGKILRINDNDKNYSFVETMSSIPSKYTWGRLFSDPRLDGGEFKVITWITIEAREDEKYYKKR